MSDGDWLTTAAAGKRLGVTPGAVVQWIHAGRLVGRRNGDRWLVDPASVQSELQRLSRASWWRTVDMPPGRAERLQQAATKRLIKAATAWRRAPDNSQLTAALIAAVDERESLTIRAKRAVEE